MGDPEKRPRLGRKIVFQAIAACLAGTLIVSGAIYRFNDRRKGYEVSYDGKVLGYVRDKNTAIDALREVKDKMIALDPYINLEDTFAFKKALVNSEKLTTEDKIAQVIETKAYIQYEEHKGYSIILNGNEIALVATEEDAKKVISEVKQYFENQQSAEGVKVIDVNIKDEIKYEQKIAGMAKRTDVETVVASLTATKGVTKKYEVKKGDTIWKIAKDNDMKISEITAVNPDLNIEKLKVGQVIYFSMSEPVLSVETTLEATIDEKIAYNTSYVSDKNLYKGQTKVVKSGEYGINRVIKQITRLNGKEIASAIVSSAVVKNPITQVLARGTKALLGSGKFLWPTSGHVTSSYGSRGREFHKGLDIGAPQGTPIKAADSGTVVHAGWSSGYGKLIIIDHGNGYQTYYGHCSSISVKVGQSVTKGQKIGAVGHTGQAYGNHLHFEIRVNGRNKNPLNYFD